jgi:hypothetical protein
MGAQKMEGVFVCRHGERTYAMGWLKWGLLLVAW